MEKHAVGWNKRRNGKEKKTETKDGEKNEKIWKLYENLNTENCLK